MVEKPAQNNAVSQGLCPGTPGAQLKGGTSTDALVWPL